MIGCKRIFDMWLACHTQEEIADATGWSQPTVKSFIENEKDFLSDKTQLAKANHEDGSFQIPIYNIWKQQEKKPPQIIVEVSNRSDREIDHKIAEAASRRVTITHKKNKAKRYAWSRTWSHNRRSTEQ
jgi:hypothetical protein